MTIHLEENKDHKQFQMIGKNFYQVKSVEVLPRRGFQENNFTTSRFQDFEYEVVVDLALLKSRPYQYTNIQHLQQTSEGHQ